MARIRELFYPGIGEFLSSYITLLPQFFGGSGRKVIKAIVFLGALTGSAVGAVVSSANLPLWKKAVEQISRDGSYWATEVQSTLSVFDDANKLLGTIKTTGGLNVVDHRPSWKETHRSRTGSPGMVIAMDLGIQASPGAILDEYASWMLLRTDIVGDEKIQVWRGVDPADARNSATLFLAESNARPRQIIFTLPFSSWAGVQLVTITLDYRASAQGAWLPWRTVVDQSGRILLRKRRIRIETEYCNWRPAT